MVIAHDINDLGDLRTARNELRRACERRSLPDDVTYDLLLCVQEACKNALRFAGGPRGVHASVSINRTEIVATVRDWGEGISPGRWRVTQPDPYSESGRGIFLMSELMDRVEVQVDHGTRVRLHKLLPAPPVPRAA